MLPVEGACFCWSLAFSLAHSSRLHPTVFSELAEAELQTAPLSLVHIVQPCAVTQKKMTSYTWGKDEVYLFMVALFSLSLLVLSILLSVEMKSFR